MDQSIQSYLKPELDEASKVLLRAAEYIATRGHCRGAFYGPQGQACVLGAMSMMVGLGQSAYDDATDRLEEALGGQWIADWSDATPTAEVLAKLRSVALGGA